MTTLGHLSDLHFWAYKDVKLRTLFNKRIIGGVNIALNRSKKHDNKIAIQALKQLDAMSVDHIAISGDLTNLAFKCEFEEAAKHVYAVKNAEKRVSIIPGNHDYYTHDTVKEKRFENTFSTLLESDLPSYLDKDPYPYCRFVGEDVAIIGLNSGMVSSPIFAIGKIKQEELNRLEALLKDPRLVDKFIVVQVHHHLLPHPRKLEAMRRLLNADALLKILRQAKVDLVLHGHNHYSNIDTLPHLEGSGDLVISGCSASSYVDHPIKEHRATFNIYTIQKNSFSIERFIFVNKQNEFIPWDTQTFPR